MPDSPSLFPPIVDEAYLAHFLGRHAEALARIDAAGAVDPPTRARLLRIRVRALLALGRTAEARAAVDRWVDDDHAPTRYQALTARSEIERATGDPVASDRTRAAADALALGSDLPGLVYEARVLRATRLAWVGDLKGAAVDLEWAGRYDGAATDPAYHNVRGRLAARRGDLPTATEAFRWVFDHGPEVRRAQACEGLAEVALRQRDHEGALRWARLGLEQPLDPKGETAGHLWTLAGEAARQCGRLDEAEQAYLEALATYANRPKGDVGITRMNLVLVRLARGAFTEAAELLDALAAEPELERGSRVVAEVGALARACCAAARGEEAAFERGLAPVVTEWCSAFAEVDLATVAELAAGLAARRRWLAGAARADRIALDQWSRVGDRLDEVRRTQQRLRRLADQGAPVPVGPFLLLRRLGAGAFGDVWQGRDPDGRDVAVKFLRRVRDRRAAEMLRNELRAVASLDHPSIVRLVGHGTVEASAAVQEPSLEPGSAWMATELADGGSLERLVGRLPWPDVAQILAGLLDGLAHAHARGILHLDVKPANVLLGGTNGQVPRLADFGLAERRGAADSGRVQGTPAFMAPEQFGGGPLGPWTDVYAVGALAVAMVSGRAPFAGTTIDEFREKHLAAELVYAPTIPVPVRLEPWVRCCVAPHPADRFRDAAEATRTLTALGPPVECGPAPISPVDLDTMPTIVLDAWAASAEPVDPPSGSERYAPGPLPAVPARWQRADLPPPVGVPPLFGLVAPRFVGREAERDTLWGLLRSVSATGSPRTAEVRGPPGSGATALIEWIAERSVELGVAEVRRGGPPPHARVPTIWVPESSAEDLPSGPVLTLTRAPTAGADAVLVLRPLADDERLRLLRGLLPLDDALAHELAELTGGCPRFAVQLVTDLVLRGRLEPAPGGLRLAGSAGLPRSLDVLLRDRADHAIGVTSRADRRALHVAASARVIDVADWTARCAAAGCAADPELLGRWLELRLLQRHPRGFRFEDERVRERVLAVTSGATAPG